jgi:hypothetical protein
VQICVLHYWFGEKVDLNGYFDRDIAVSATFGELTDLMKCGEITID